MLKHEAILITPPQKNNPKPNRKIHLNTVLIQYMQLLSAQGCDKRACVGDRRRPCVAGCGFLYLWPNASALCKTERLHGAGRLGFFFCLVGVFPLIPSFEFLKPFCATVYKRNTGLRPRLGYALGFRTFEDYDLPQDLVNSKNSFLILQKV